MRSLLALEEALPVDPLVLPTAPALTGHAFTELAVDGVSGPVVADVLDRLGFAHTGQHRSKPVQLWEQGTARVLLNAGAARSAGSGEAAVVALALESTDPTGSAARAEALLAPVLPRTRGRAEAELSAVAAPDGTQVFFARTGPDGWPADFLATGETAAGAGLTGTDHVGLTQPFDAYDEAGLFYRSVLGLLPEAGAEVAAPFGLVRSRGVTTPGRDVRLALSVSLLRRGGGWAPGVPDPQHVAFATDDVVATARALRAAGAPLLAVPANYHDDLDDRLELDPGLLADLREHGLFYDADATGAFLHLYTEVLGGRVFFEVVQRLTGYDGYGAVNSPVRMAAHRRARTGG
jgi:4-hydroxyphenylpyruvate dioxygenase